MTEGATATGAGGVVTEGVTATGAGGVVIEGVTAIGAGGAYLSEGLGLTYDTDDLMTSLGIDYLCTSKL